MEGTPPFGLDPNPMAVLHRVASGQLIPPQRSGPLTPLLLRMMAPEPADRPTMAEVSRTLTLPAMPTRRRAPRARRAAHRRRNAAAQTVSGLLQARAGRPRRARRAQSNPRRSTEPHPGPASGTR